MADPAAEKFESHLLHQYGPTISGPDLYEALGFKTYAAFHSCHQRDEIGVNVFKRKRSVASPTKYFLIMPSA